MSRGPAPALLTVGSAVLLAAALPNEITPWGNPLLGFVAVAPLLAATVVAGRPRDAARLGALWGALHTLLSSFWLMFFQEFAIWTLGGVVLAYAGFGALLGAVLRGVTRAGPDRYRPFLLAAVWTVYEYLKSSGFLGYPWGLLAHPVHAVLPLVQVADISGVWGVSLLVSLANSLVAEGLIRVRPGAAPARGSLALRQVGVLAALAVAALGYGTWRLAQPDPAGSGVREMRLLLVQPNGDPWHPFESESMANNLALSVRGAREAVAAGAPPDLVVWSETSLSFDPAITRSRSLLEHLRRMGVPHLTGAPVIVDARRRLVMNGAVLLDPTGAVVESYGKQHPVPFAEAIPFWESPVVQAFFTDVVGIQYPWVMGSEAVVFATPIGAGGVARFGVPICFEDAFGDTNRAFVMGGADLLVNISNDSWSRTVSALMQHFVVARYRTVETRRPLVRATNGGITAVVDARGRLTGMLPWFRPGYLAAKLSLPPQPRITPYVLYGDWLPIGLGGVLVLYLGWNVARARRRDTALLSR